MRRLVITDHGSYVTVQNAQGLRAQARDVEGALQRLSGRFALDFTPTSGFEAAAMLDTLMGPKSGDTGNIHQGVLPG